MGEQVFHLDTMSMNFLTAFDHLPAILPTMDAGEELLRDTFQIDAGLLQHQTVESQIPTQERLPPFESFLPQQLLQNPVLLSQEIQPLNGEMTKKRKNEEEFHQNVNDIKKKRPYKPRQPKVTGETDTKKKRSYKPRKPKVVEDVCPPKSTTVEVVEEVVEEGKCGGESNVMQVEMEEETIKEQVEKKEKKKTTPSLITLIDNQLENNSSLLLSYCSQLVRALIDDTSYRVSKSQPVLSQLKMDVFTTASSILECSQKQKDYLEKMKSTLLTTLYPVSPEVMEMSTDKPMFSSKVIENLSRKKKVDEEREMVEKQIKEMDSTYPQGEKKKIKKMIKYFRLLNLPIPRKVPKKRCTRLFVHLLLILLLMLG